jgi:hypothetical protein
MIKTKLNLCGSLWNLSALCEIWLLHREPQRRHRGSWRKQNEKVYLVCRRFAQWVLFLQGTSGAGGDSEATGEILMAISLVWVEF